MLGRHLHTVGAERWEDKRQWHQTPSLPSNTGSSMYSKLLGPRAYQVAEGIFIQWCSDGPRGPHRHWVQLRVIFSHFAYNKDNLRRSSVSQKNRPLKAYEKKVRYLSSYITFKVYVWTDLQRYVVFFFIQIPCVRSDKWATCMKSLTINNMNATSSFSIGQCQWGQLVVQHQVVERKKSIISKLDWIIIWMGIDYHQTWTTYSHRPLSCT